MNAIEIIQSIKSPFLDTFFQFVSDLVSDKLVVIIVCVVFWCANRRNGYTFLLTICSGMGLNLMLKNLLRVSRPEFRYENVKVVGEYPDKYAFPSGHAQNSVLVYGQLYKRVHKAFWWLATIIIILVGVSRIYLGMHAIEDVVIGIIVGFIWIYIGSKIYDYVYTRTAPVYILWFMVPSLLSLFSTTKLWFGVYAEPENIYETLFLTLGVVLGSIFEHYYIKFVTDISIPRKIVKCIVGLLGLLILYRSLPSIFGDTTAGTSITYFAVGIWVTVVVPLFSKYILERWKLTGEKEY